jgi:Enoyl-CoA hydratase/carnithine racemase
LSDVLLAEREGPVVWLTLNRPEKRNALNRELRSRLLEELRRAEEDQQVRVVVIRGAGGNFCAVLISRSSSSWTASA